MSTKVYSFTNKGIIVFYSYAEEDKKLQERLDKHLSILKHLGRIKVWHTHMIRPGQDKDIEIIENLNAAHIILLLLSPDFLASDYCYSDQMRKALARYERGLIWIIPILLRPVDWQGTPLDKLQALPENAKPVVLWRDRDEAFVNVAKNIRKIIDDMSMTEDERKRLAEERRQREIEDERKRLAEERRQQEVEDERGKQSESLWSRFLKNTGLKRDKDIDADEVGFTILQAINDPDVRIVQGIFDKKGDSSPILQGRFIESSVGLKDYYKEIIQRCDNDLKGNPHNAYTYCEKAHALKMSKKYGEALVAYEKTLSLGLDTIEVNHSRAKVLYQLARYKEAADIYKKLVQRKPNDAYIYFSYGIVLRELKLHEVANTAFYRAYEINPSINKLYQDEENALEEDIREINGLFVYY